MTNQPINPLINGKGNGPKATVADLEAGAERLNGTAIEFNCPWRFAVLPREDGKRTIRKVLQAPSPRMLRKVDVMDRRGERMTIAETAELNDRLEKLGATARYREDGSRHTLSH